MTHVYSRGLVVGGPLDEAEPWMLEADFIQEGGQADAVENEPEPDVSELYDMVPYNHQQYARYCSVAWPAPSNSGKVSE